MQGGATPFDLTGLTFTGLMYSLLSGTRARNCDMEERKWEEPRGHQSLVGLRCFGKHPSLWVPQLPTL